MARTKAAPVEVRTIRVGLYTRVSTDNQASKEEGSLDTQEARLRAAVLARSGRFEITHVFREEGESGKSLDRPALQRLLEHVRNGELDLIMVTRIDRLSRSLLDFYEMHRLFEANEVQFVSLNETFDTSSAVGRAMLKLVLVFAELEREQTAERTRLAIAARAERGLWNGGAPPLGYDALKGGKLQPVPHEVQLVQTIYAKYLELRSAVKVTEWLHTQGMRQKTWSSRRRGHTGGQPFNMSVVRHILTNRLYLGEIEHKGACYKGQHDAIIDSDTFERVGSIMESNHVITTGARGSAQFDYLLTGLLRCSCGHALTSSSGQGNGGCYYYYRCTGVQKHVGHACTVRQIRAERVEEAVLSVIRQAARAPALVERAVLEANRLAQDTAKPLEKQRNLLKRELEVTHKQAQELLSGLLQSGLLSHATGRGMLEELEQRQEQLKKSVREAEEALAQSWQPELDLEVVREALKGFDGVFLHLSLEEKRELLQALVKEVEVEKEQVKVKLYEGAGVVELVRGLKKIARACPGGTLQHYQTEPEALPENAANPSKARPWRSAYNPSPNLPIEVCSDDGLAPPDGLEPST